MPAPRLLIVLASAVVLSGCLGSAPEALLAAPSLDAAPDHFAPGWPELAQARVRPGVHHGFAAPAVAGVLEVREEFSDCTGNFIFRSPDNRSLYLGTAAHRVDAMGLGEPFVIDRSAASGTLWYSAWHTLAAMGVTDSAAFDANEFALIRIDDEHPSLVHPAALHSGVADPASVERGAPVVAFGNSDLRRGPEELDRHEGFVSRPGRENSVLYMRGPIVPGDSGSPAPLASGEALGVLVRLGTLDEFKRGNIVTTNLAPSLGFARENEGVEVELATWPLLEAPVATQACAALPLLPEPPAAG